MKFPRLIFLLFIVFWCSTVIATPKNNLVIKDKYVFTNIKLAKLRSKFFLKKLKSGITQKLIFHVSLYKKGKSRKPVVSIFKYCTVTYDLWEEKFIAICMKKKIKTKFTVKKNKLLINLFSTFREKLILSTKINKNASYYVKLNFKLNPISPKLLKKIRLWMRQSESSSQGTNYVGSFLSLFINKDIGGSDLNISIKTKPIKGSDFSNE